MAIQTLKNKLNFRQIITHFIAACFLMFAFQTFFSLHEIKLINIYRYVDRHKIVFELDKQGITGTDLVNFRFWTNTGKIVGLLIAFLISIAIGLKKSWHWQNATIVLVLACAFATTRFIGFNYLQNLYYLPVLSFLNTNVWLIMLSTLFFSIGIFIFFNKKINEYIEQSNKPA